MCQPWNVDLHPEQFPRAIRLQAERGRLAWASPGKGDGEATVEGSWISDHEFQANDGRVFVCPPTDASGQRRGEVTIRQA